MMIVPIAGEGAAVIHFACPNCAGRYEMEDARAGDRFTCPCGQRVEVPRPSFKTTLGTLVPAPMASVLPEGINRAKIITGCLALTLGWLGIHKDWLGFRWTGIMLTLLSIVGGFTFGLIVPLIVWAIGITEGVLYLTRSDREFYDVYIVGRRRWF